MSRKSDNTSKDFQFEKETKQTYPSDIPLIKEPVDTNNMTYFLMLLYGIGALLPWNAILTALDFFKEKVNTHIFLHIMSSS